MRLFRSLNLNLNFEGLHDEKGAQKEELDGALVCPSTHLAVILRL